MHEMDTDGSGTVDFPELCFWFLCNRDAHTRWHKSLDLQSKLLIGRAAMVGRQLGKASAALLSAAGRQKAARSMRKATAKSGTKAKKRLSKIFQMTRRVGTWAWRKAKETQDKYVPATGGRLYLPVCLDVFAREGVVFVSRHPVTFPDSSYFLISCALFI